jgi:dihydroorotase
MSTLRINNATIVNEGKKFSGDILVKDGRIAALGVVPTGTKPGREIDATGLLAIPGLIDDQVHFREPGLTHKADIGSESRAAVIGGVTSFMEMPNTSPSTTTIEALEWKYARAAQTSPANYSFYFGVTNDNLEEMRKVDARTVCGLKMFMGSSTGNMLVDNAEIIDRVFKEAHMLVATHCEDTPMIKAAEAAALTKYGEDVPAGEHPHIRNAEACYKSSALAVELAKRHGTRLHILHITTAKELALFSDLPLAQKRITAEACVHHLWYSESDYATLAHKIKCNPAIKSAADRDAVRAAVNSGLIDVIATDHAPHTLGEKAQSYFKAPSGLPLVQHSLPMLLDLWKDGVFDLETIVRKTSHAVADLYQIKDRGYLREGAFADIVLVDPNAGETVGKANIAYKCGWSPLEGHRFRTKVVATIVNGFVAYDNGALAEHAPAGRRLEFTR